MPQHTTVLESPTKRIRLVPPSASDDEASAICRAHPTTRQFLQFLPEHMSTDEARIRREERMEDKHIVDFNVHYLKENGTIIFGGFCGYFNIDEYHNSCESGIIISPELHGAGIATEAFYVLLRHIFEERKFHRTTFETGADNIPMQQWLEKVAGVRLESERKEVWKGVDGSYADVKGYAILEREWTSHVKVQLEKRLARHI